jgi:uncharacterized protein
LLRQIPDDFDPETVAAIDALLLRVEADECVSILHAIESGSRAWGFPSPDSDYDCRFFFVRRTADYLSPWQKRDVIETPLVDDLDVNGWELGKALRLMLKGNAVVLEWLTSPIVYRSNETFHQKFGELAERTTSRDGLGRHYLHLGLRQWRTYFGDGDSAAIKRLFYVLRPAMALRWLRANPSRVVPPMHFPTLLDECEPAADLAALCAELIARKAETRELGEAPVPDLIRSFVVSEFELGRASFENDGNQVTPSIMDEVSRFFREIVDEQAEI